MKNIFLLLLILIFTSGCISVRIQNRHGLRPFYYSPRTHYGPFYKHPKPKQMRPHFNKELNKF